MQFNCYCISLDTKPNKSFDLLHDYIKFLYYQWKKKHLREHFNDTDFKNRPQRNYYQSHSHLIIIIILPSPNITTEPSKFIKTNWLPITFTFNHSMIWFCFNAGSLVALSKPRSLVLANFWPPKEFSKQGVI